MTYKNLLTKIQNAAIETTTTVDMPSNKQLYEIDLSSRTIHGPATISVQGEHYAETVYFLVDRFYDNMDLAQTNCVIHYVINDKSYVYAVPFCDARSYDGKIIIPWTISMSATQKSGPIQYFIRFYLLNNSNLGYVLTQDNIIIPNKIYYKKLNNNTFIRVINPNNDELNTYYEDVVFDSNATELEYIYNLNTQPATSRVLTTLPQEDFVEEDNTLKLPTYYEELISNLNSMIDTATVFWIDV